MKRFKLFEDEDATEPMAGAASADKPVRNDIETMVGVTDLEYIASGQFGDVYSYSSEHGDVAVKILSTTTGGGRANTMTIQREINNYELVGIAVESNPQVAKHFPKVYDVGYKTIPDGVLGYIVMELVRIIIQMKLYPVCLLVSSFSRDVRLVLTLWDLNPFRKTYN